MTEPGKRPRIFSAYERNQIFVLLFAALMFTGFFYYRLHHIRGQEAVSRDIDGVDRLVNVEIKGEVLRPGVYEMRPGSNISELLKQSGAPNWVEAYPDTWRDIPLQDGTQVQVWRDAQGQPQMAVSRMGASSLGLLLLKMDVNEASVEDLESLPGIGEATARAIVEYRYAHGPFNSIEDLKAIKGIGDKTVENLRHHVVVGQSPLRLDR